MENDDSLKYIGSVPSLDDEPPKSPPSEDRAGPGKGVTVDISERPPQIPAIEARLDTGDAFDAARVAEIKQAISAGRFNVDAEVVADRLLEIVKKLIAGYHA